jgi:hypothetical protein
VGLRFSKCTGGSVDFFLPAPRGSFKSKGHLGLGDFFEFEFECDMRRISGTAIATKN